MRELNKWQNILFRVGALLLLLGFVQRLFGLLVETSCWTLALGAVLFASMQMLSSYEGDDFQLKRLRRQQIFSDFLFLLMAGLLVMQDMGWGPDWTMGNAWLLPFIVGTVLQLYTAFRIPQLLSSLVLGTLTISSCATQYHVEGVTDRGMLEGKMLYVKVFDKDNMVAIDSCQVRHGQLTFTGELDTTKFVAIYMDDQYVGPLVLEEGTINLTLNEIQSEVKGSPYNDSLNVYLNQFQQYCRARMQLGEEYQRCQKSSAQLILDGMSVEECNTIIGERLNSVIARLDELDAQQDALETSFIIRNSNNVLGPGVFMLMTWKQPYPYLTPQIEEILLRSYPYLKEHPYVKLYIDAARKNMEQMRQ